MSAPKYYPESSAEVLRRADEIESKIYKIRGLKVILDSDIAVLYQVSTYDVTRAVKRNGDRFPKDFVFQLTNQEIIALNRQIGGSSSGRQHGGRRTSPQAFTQEGVAMLSSVLRSKRAAQVNIAIMRAFVKIRQALISHEDLAAKINALEKKHDHQFKMVFNALRELMSDKAVPRKRVIGWARDA